MKDPLRSDSTTQKSNHMAVNYKLDDMPLSCILICDSDTCLFTNLLDCCK